eukprot:Clim_evm3s235 gene=Clim_evmTU3s235
MAPAKVPTVPESVLKKRKAVEKARAQKAAELAETKKANKAKRREIFKRAEKYVKEYRNQEKDEIRLRREAKKVGNFYVPAEPKLALVVRIRGINGMAPRTRKILRLLRLTQINNAVFVKMNKPMANMLRLVEPYIAFGYPSLKTVRELIYKRGYGKSEGKRTAIQDNKIIEQALGEKDIICVEDLVHEIYTVGPNFKQANNFLWPFQLNSSRKGLRLKRRHFIEGGDYGNREHLINELVARMN